MQILATKNDPKAPKKPDNGPKHVPKASDKASQGKPKPKCPIYFVRPLNKGMQLFSTLSYNQEQLPFPGQVFLLLSPRGIKAFYSICTAVQSCLTLAVRGKENN